MKNILLSQADSGLRRSAPKSRTVRMTVLYESLCHPLPAYRIIGGTPPGTGSLLNERRWHKNKIRPKNSATMNKAKSVVTAAREPAFLKQ